MNEAVSKRQTGNWRFEAASSESGQREGGNPRPARSTGRAGQGYGAASQHGFKYFSKNQREDRPSLADSRPGETTAMPFFAQGDPARPFGHLQGIIAGAGEAQNQRAGAFLDPAGNSA